MFTRPFIFVQMFHTSVAWWLSSPVTIPSVCCGWRLTPAHLRLQKNQVCSITRDAAATSSPNPQWCCLQQCGSGSPCLTEVLCNLEQALCREAGQSSYTLITNSGEQWPAACIVCLKQLTHYSQGNNQNIHNVTSMGPECVVKRYSREESSQETSLFLHQILQRSNMFRRVHEIRRNHKPLDCQQISGYKRAMPTFTIRNVALNIYRPVYNASLSNLRHV